MRSILVLISLLCCSLGDLVPATVTQNNQGQLQIKVGVFDPNGVAFGSFDDALHENGWGNLQIETNSDFPDNLQMKAAGFLEGALTSSRIYEHHVNMHHTFFGNASRADADVLAWLSKQDNWARKMIRSESSAFWTAASFVMSQFDGLVEGYASQSHSPPLTVDDFRILNAVGDLLDLQNVLHPHKAPKWDVMSPEEVLRATAFAGHCSGLIKVTPDFSNLFMAHSSWFTYGAMNRIMKAYKFNLLSPHVKAKATLFSSYPGFLESLDDFYEMDSGLVMVQTTNNIFNQTLYKAVKPESLLAWQRVRIANFVAASGEEWYSAVSTHNSGTYNNQYMVVDLKLFTPGEMLKPNTLWVMEQVPGLVVGKDTTQELEFGFFPSFNVPYFKEIWEISGYGDMVKKTGSQELTWDLAPRATIFRRDQTTVRDLDSLKHIMRYNDYQHDPLSKGNPMNAICSRGDLLATHPTPGGCYDTKVADLSMARRMALEAENGPTHQQQKPFIWTKEFDDTTHEGMPEEFNFGFVEFSPKWQ